nr:MAG: capsid protein [Guiyang Dicistro-like virus 1]
MSQMGENPLPNLATPVIEGDQQGTTTFVSATHAESYDRHSSSIDPMNDYDLEVDDIKDIADFLAKPMPVATGTYSTSNTWGDQLYTGDILTLINSNPIWFNKLQGFLNMRGDVKLRLVVNATPFQAGLLKLSYFPCQNQLTQEATAHTYNRMTISQLPGTYLNMKDSFVEVTVPYIAPTSFLNRDQVYSGNHVSWGQIYLHVFELMRTGTGPTSVNWTLWMSIENLELSGMVQPQMADAPRRKRRGRGLPPQEQEANSGKGPIGKIMASGTKLANDLSAIPLLKPLAEPASWVTSAIGAFCDSLGWSKPTVTDGPCAQYINAHTYGPNTKGNDNAAPLSLDPDNKIEPIMDASPGSLDEMSFNYIKSRWSYLFDFMWDTTRPSGDLLTNLKVCPTNFRQSQVIGGSRFVSVIPPCAVFSEFYRQFRGSFEIRVRVIKTGYHTGTIMVGYAPGLRSQIPSYADSAYVYRNIIDLQEGDETTMDLIYQIPQDYVNIEDSIGDLFVYVVNPLQAPATVSGTVDVFVEIRGGNDLTYAVPKGLTVSPFIPQIYEPQGVDTQEKGEINVLTMGSRIHKLDNVHHAAIAVGDFQQSFTELIKAAYPVSWATAITSPGTSTGTYYLATNRLYGSRYDGTNFSSSELGGDLISFIGSFYALQRGSQRWRVMPADHSASNQSYRGMFLSNSSSDGWEVGGLPGQTWWASDSSHPVSSAPWATMISSTDSAPGDFTGGYSNRVFQTPCVNGGIAVQTPYYCKYRYELNHIVAAPGVSQLSYTTNNGVAFYTPSVSSNLVMRSAGDDFQFAYFVGIPCYAQNSDVWNKKN